MVRKLLCSLLTVSMAFAINAQSITGVWSGELKVSRQMALKLVFHINGDNTVTMDSPDQGAYGIQGEMVYVSQDSVNMKVPKLMMSYAGRLKGDVIDGIFQQGGMKLPLKLTSGNMKANRPQTPTPPFPYTTEEITVSNGDVSLAGTLTVPDNSTKKTPVVVMVTGSGQQNRDEELFEHKPFAVIADYLARNGIASFRYDDRGMGASTGDFARATTADFASDAASVVKFIRNMRRFGKVGLLGHSEGGLIAYMLGAKPKTLDFIVSVAGPSVRGDSILVHQNLNNLAKAGITGKVADDFGDALGKAFQLKIDNPDTVLTDEILTQLYPTWNSDVMTRQLAQGIRGMFDPRQQTPWMQYFITYSPSADLQTLSIPAMIIYGEKDTQVPARLNVGPAQRNAPKALIKTYPYANHLMQHALTGNVEEYKTIEETFSPEILADIASFITNIRH